MVWAHHSHIRNHGRAGAPTPMRNMGSWITERRRAETDTVGVYMYRGSAAMNDRQVYAVQTPRSPQSLEAILYRARLRYAFYDPAGQPRSTGSQWPWEQTHASDWGTVPYAMVLRDQYDGIVFVDTTRPPSYF